MTREELQIKRRQHKEFPMRHIKDRKCPWCGEEMLATDGMVEWCENIKTEMEFYSDGGKMLSGCSYGMRVEVKADQPTTASLITAGCVSTSVIRGSTDS